MGHFGTSLIALMTERGIRVDELAERMGVAPGKVTRWRSSAHGPKFADAVAMAAALGITVDELARRTVGATGSTVAPDALDAAERLLDELQPGERGRSPRDGHTEDPPASRRA